MIFGNFYLVYDVDYAENMKKIITKINNSNEFVENVETKSEFFKCESLEQLKLKLNL